MRILLIEDEPKIISALKRGLEIEGFVVDVETSGDAGLHRALTDTFDAIILDIMLPNMNGFLVCRKIREAQNWTPILVLTAKGGEYDEAEALDTGADDYLTKPFSFVVLLAHIRALLRRTGKVEPSGVYEAGDLTLDPAAHRCFRNGEPIELTSREFAVLYFLMRRKGTVVNKTDIIDNVWDFSFSGDLNIVEVYIRHLRRKIDEPFGRHSIETIRGVGYRLSESGG